MLRIKEGDNVKGEYNDRDGQTISISGTVTSVFSWGVQTTIPPNDLGTIWRYNLFWSEITHINNQPI